MSLEDSFCFHFFPFCQMSNPYSVSFIQEDPYVAASLSEQTYWWNIFVFVEIFIRPHSHLLAMRCMSTLWWVFEDLHGISYIWKVLLSVPTCTHNCVHIMNVYEKLVVKYCNIYKLMYSGSHITCSMHLYIALRMT